MGVAERMPDWPTKEGSANPPTFGTVLPLTGGAAFPGWLGAGEAAVAAATRRLRFAGEPPPLATAPGAAASGPALRGARLRLCTAKAEQCSRTGW